MRKTVRKRGEDASKPFGLTSVIAAVSLANLAFLDAWNEVFSTEGDYYRQTYADGLEALAVVVDVGLLTGIVLLFAFFWHRKRTRYAGGLGLVCVGLMAVNAIRHQ